MHFWIDKRSQACGYNGRSRVAASLSSGSSFGFNQPRRFRGKSMVTPIHRFPTVECTRPHLYRPPTSSQQASPNNLTAHHHSSTSSSQQLHQHHSSPRQNQSQASSPIGLQYQTVHVHTNRNYNSSPVIIPERPPIDDTTTMISAITTRPQIAMAGGSSYEPQLLPSHLKLGLWASLALATIFVTSAKFYFDHQGTGFEVLIFCAFSAAFFLAACGVSLCKRPDSRDSINTAHTIQTQTDQIPTVEIGDGRESNMTNYADAMAAVQAVQPPPPYHIAILLPETTKEEIDDSPPPAYDKIMI